MNERIHTVWTVQPSVKGAAADIMPVICPANCLGLNDVTQQVSEHTILKREEAGTLNM